jgi:RIO-like serine/threonine protein kinase
MNPDLYVLRALARLSRQRKTVDDESLVLRAGGTTGEVHASLERLAGDGLIAWAGLSGQQIRLTLSGLAVAVASASAARASRGAVRPSASRAELHGRPSRRRAA